MDWGALLKGLAPIIVQAFVPGTTGQMIGGLVTDGMLEAQAIHGVPDGADAATRAAVNAEKKQHVLGLVKDFAVGVNAAKQAEVLPVAPLVEAGGSAIDTAIEITNYVHAVSNGIPATPVGAG